jgi:hypothetical protein
MRTPLTGLVVAAVTLALPAVALAQAGVVTTLQGSATVARVSATPPAGTPAGQPEILPLVFKQKVFYQDVITTQETSLVRILMGGKAVVTVRERSSLRITEAAGNATVDIKEGRVALVVAKEKMAPGQRIDVKTPNAVAAVRGTILITEVEAPPSAPPTSNFTLLQGVVDVSLLDPSGRAIGSPITLNPLQALGITGNTPPTGPRNISRTQGNTAANSFHANLKEPPTGSNQQITESHIQQVNNITGGGSGGAGGGGTTTIGGGDPFKNVNNSTGGGSGNGNLNGGVSGDDLKCRDNCGGSGGGGSGLGITTGHNNNNNGHEENCDCLSEGRARTATRSRR